MTFPARRATYGPGTPLPGAPENPMPTGNLPDFNGAVNFTWEQVYAEDFLTDVALGGIVASNSGADPGRLHASCAAYGPYNDSFKVKSDGPDTSGFAQYNSQKTSYISDSIFTIACHQEAGVSYGAGLKPWVPPALSSDPNFFTYAKTSYLVRAVADPVLGGQVAQPGWGCAFMYINSFAWPENGEWDYLEGGLASSNIGGFYHYANPAGGQITLPGTGPFSEWIKVDLEWMPDAASGGARGRIYANGVEIMNRTAQVAVAPMTLGFTIQVGSNTGVAPTGVAHVQFDWITMYRYAA